MFFLNIDKKLTRRERNYEKEEIKKMKNTLTLINRSLRQIKAETCHQTKETVSAVNIFRNFYHLTVFLLLYLRSTSFIVEKKAFFCDLLKKTTVASHLFG